MDLAPDLVLAHTLHTRVNIQVGMVEITLGQATVTTTRGALTSLMGTLQLVELEGEVEVVEAVLLLMTSSMAHSSPTPQMDLVDSSPMTNLSATA